MINMDEELRWGEYSTTWDRFERALHLFTEETYEDGGVLPDDHFRVGKRYVSLDERSCDCPDFEWGDHRLCKHYIAVLLDMYDPIMLTYLKRWKMEHK